MDYTKRVLAYNGFGYQALQDFVLKTPFKNLLCARKYANALPKTRQGKIA